VWVLMVPISSLSLAILDGELDLRSRGSDVFKDVRSGSSPTFSPSIAIVPLGRGDISDNVKSLFDAFENKDICIQSFLNNLAITSESSQAIFPCLIMFLMSPHLMKVYMHE